MKELISLKCNFLHLFSSVLWQREYMVLWSGYLFTMASEFIV